MQLSACMERFLCSRFRTRMYQLYFFRNQTKRHCILPRKIVLPRLLGFETVNRDILKSVKDVNNVDEYISVTQDVTKQSKNVKVQINITTVLTLKKIRCFEIEYQNKCDENGIACIILERLLALPPSKAWESLGKELVCLLQYWLEAIRKHLLNHSHRWWTFLKQLLMFIKHICPKSPTIPDLLAEHLTECLLDIATSELPDPFQRHEILQALNVYCAKSSRDIRFAMRNKFADYFVKLASQIATSGYLPHQYNVLECLVRWLVPRKERLLRAAAADRWFPSDLYPNEAVQIFKQANWNNFFQDARDFLNALNVANGLVSSVVVRRLCVGDIAIISFSEKQESWLDLNTVGPCVSVLLDPRPLRTFGVRDFCTAFALCVTEYNTVTVRLYRLNLLVDVQSQLAHLQEEKIDIQNEANRKSRELDAKFMENLKCCFKFSMNFASNFRVAQERLQAETGDGRSFKR